MRYISKRCTVWFHFRLERCVYRLMLHSNICCGRTSDSRPTWLSLLQYRDARINMLRVYCSYDMHLTNQKHCSQFDCCTLRTKNKGIHIVHMVDGLGVHNKQRMQVDVKLVFSDLCGSNCHLWVWMMSQCNWYGRFYDVCYVYGISGYFPRRLVSRYFPHRLVSGYFPHHLVSGYFPHRLVSGYFLTA